MTNQQLAILIRAWRNRLEREIDILDGLLPADMPRETTRVYVGETILAGMIQTERNDPEKWQEQPGDFLALLGLRELTEELGDAADVLLREENSQP